MLGLRLTPMKLLYVVVDGLADSMKDRTSLEEAYTPNMDYVARIGRCGLMYTVGRGYAPESDVAVMSILGYEPEKYYTGRGPLEALGAGLEFREGWEVAFRANFATVDSETLEIIDRRVGRSLTTAEAKKLAKSLDGVKLAGGDGYVKVASTVAHRGVVIVGSKVSRLSDNVTNTDPAYVRIGKVSTAAKREGPLRIVECRPLDDSPEAKYTAELVNEFTRVAIEVLRDHPVNLERERRGLLKANAVLLRDPGGRLPKLPSLKSLYGMDMAAIAEMPVEIGIARVLGINPVIVNVEGADRRAKLRMEAEKTLELLEQYDAVYVHIKGPDEPGHDGSLEGKVREIELIDSEFLGPVLDRVDLAEAALLLTSDHATPYTAKSHTDDPVPVAVAYSRLEPDGVRKFTERECAGGALGIIEHGWELLPRIIEELGWRA